MCFTSNRGLQVFSSCPIGSPVARFQLLLEIRGDHVRGLFHLQQLNEIQLQHRYILQRRFCASKVATVCLAFASKCILQVFRVFESAVTLSSSLNTLSGPSEKLIIKRSLSLTLIGNMSRRYVNSLDNSKQII